MTDHDKVSLSLTKAAKTYWRLIRAKDFDVRMIGKYRRELESEFGRDEVLKAFERAK